MRFCRTMILVGAAALGAGAGVRVGTAQTIHMAGKAVVVGKVVQVGDIGTIDGCDAATAEKLAQMVVVAKFTDSVKVRSEDVLLAVMTQGDPRVGCKVQVQGAAECQVRAEAGDGSTEEAQGPIGALPVAANRAVTADDLSVVGSVVTAGTGAGPGTAVTTEVIKAGKKDGDKPEKGQPLAEMLKEQVLNDLEAVAEDVHVTFETNSPLLDAAAGAGQRWQYRTLVGGGKSSIGTVEWEAQLMQGRQVMQKLLVTARVLRRVPSVVTLATIERGEVVLGKNLKAEDRWLDRKMPGLMSGINEVVGQEATRGIPAGSYLDSRDFKNVELTAYGDALTVYFLSGNLRIKGSGKALGAGKLHDHINVENEATKERFDGLLIGRHVVVVGNALDAKIEQQLRENQNQ